MNHLEINSHRYFETMGSYLRIQSNPLNDNIIGLKTFVYQRNNSLPVINLALILIKRRLKGKGVT